MSLLHLVAVNVILMSTEGTKETEETNLSNNFYKNNEYHSAINEKSNSNFLINHYNKISKYSNKNQSHFVQYNGSINRQSSENIPIKITQNNMKFHVPSMTIDCDSSKLIENLSGHESEDARFISNYDRRINLDFRSNKNKAKLFKVKKIQKITDAISSGTVDEVLPNMALGKSKYDNPKQREYTKYFKIPDEPQFSKINEKIEIENKHINDESSNEKEIVNNISKMPEYPEIELESTSTKSTDKPLRIPNETKLSDNRNVYKLKNQSLTDEPNIEEISTRETKRLKIKTTIDDKAQHLVTKSQSTTSTQSSTKTKNVLNEDLSSEKPEIGLKSYDKVGRTKIWKADDNDNLNRPKNQLLTKKPNLDKQSVGRTTGLKMETINNNNELTTKEVQISSNKAPTTRFSRAPLIKQRSKYFERKNQLLEVNEMDLTHLMSTRLPLIYFKTNQIKPKIQSKPNKKNILRQLIFENEYHEIDTDQSTDKYNENEKKSSDHNEILYDYNIYDKNNTFVKNKENGKLYNMNVRKENNETKMKCNKNRIPRSSYLKLEDIRESYNPNNFENSIYNPKSIMIDEFSSNDSTL